ncbi:hypothetical protein JHK85_001496 [Glycine max]|nr:hypothetical protein JHK85_001496 [Glycine max]
MGLVAAAEVFEAHRISAKEFRSSTLSIIKNENLVLKFRERYLLWEKVAPLVLGITVFGLDLLIEPKDTIPVGLDDVVKAKNDAPGPASSGRRWRLWPMPFRRVKTIDHTNSVSSEEVFVDSKSDFQTSIVEPSPTSAMPISKFITISQVITTIGFAYPNKANSYSWMLQGRILDSHTSLSMCQKMSRSMDGEHWSRHTPKGTKLEAEWNAKFVEYEKKYNEEAAELKAIIIGKLPGRKRALLYIASLLIIHLFASCIFHTYTPKSPADATRNLVAIWISALCEAGVIYPIEHLASFRAMPNTFMLRPADGNDTAGSYKVVVVNKKRPSIVALCWQKLTQLPRTSIEGVEKGGYLISDNSSSNKPDVILIGTGSKLEIVVAFAEDLWKEGKVVIVSDEFNESVLPASITARVSIEAGSTFGCHNRAFAKRNTPGLSVRKNPEEDELYSEKGALSQKSLTCTKRSIYFVRGVCIGIKSFSCLGFLKRESSKCMLCQGHSTVETGLTLKSLIVQG